LIKNEIIILKRKAMRTKLIIIIAILVAAFSCPAEAQVKVKLNVKGLLNTVVKETEKTANKKTGNRTRTDFRPNRIEEK